MAVDTPCTYQFLNFLAIAAPSSRIAAFNIVVGALAGSGYTLVVAERNRITGDVRGFSLGCLLINIGELSGSSFLDKP
ncbi:hypothetical protein [Photobacterium sanguinicancri]|uniref:hypothetical protein n=1 Tax=Photobacterium sanguinicancri TaxID=875932 RepID=UPI0026E24415|nr:hypothetical protein [Photobacterium sanguinicancri]MDO6499296.1 hypothetical protein [Photobacterium sanguinicancri]